MPTRTDFYLLKSTDENARFLTVCRIVEKAYLNSHQIYIYCENENQSDSIDKLLWTFKETSFIPHQKINNNSDVPILIGHLSSPPPTTHDILINLTKDVPNFFKPFQRIIEVIPDNTELREKAREKYRFYREHNCELYSHPL
jgi:DNA polymerase-3 subunit chi